MHPPPWHLTGDGYIWLFKFPKDFIERNGFMTDWQRAALKHTLGAMMLVDYRETPVGPYRELLFIPGVFAVGAHALRRAQDASPLQFSISKIYVSTQVSVVNGIEHWGIPKERADFAYSTYAGADTLTASINGTPFFSARLNPFGPRFPLTSSLLPLRVIQDLRGQKLVTQPTAKGSARLCRVHDLHVAAAQFPDVSSIKPIAVIAVNNFQMTFPAAHRLPM
jgi:hypothetical protein